MGTTAQEIKDYVKRRMGHPCVRVELSDDQLQDAVDEASLWFGTHIGQLGVQRATTNGNTNEYDVVTAVEEIVDVVFEVSGDSPYNIFDFAEVEIEPFGFRNGRTLDGGFYSDIVQVFQYWEQARRILGIDKNWEWDRPRRKLILYPSPKTAFQYMYSYTTSAIDLTVLSQRECWLVRQWALAQGMETLGYVRSKYSEIPSASGGFSLNGDTLLSNAETMRMELNEKVKLLAPPIPFLVG